MLKNHITVYWSFRLLAHVFQYIKTLKISVIVYTFFVLTKNVYICSFMHIQLLQNFTACSITIYHIYVLSLFFWQF